MSIATIGAPLVIAQGEAEPAIATPAQDLHPAAMKIAEQVVKALGGRDRVAAIKTLRVVTHDAEHASLKYEHHWSRNGGWALKVLQEEYPPQITASSGDLSWRQNALDEAPSLISGEQASSARRSVDSHVRLATLPSYARERFASFTVGEPTEFNGAGVTVLQFEEKDSDASGVIYVNAESMMPEGWQRFWPKQGGGRHTMLEIFHEWAPTEGVQFLRKWTTQSDMFGMESPVTVVETVEVNTLKATDFEPPAELKEQARRAAEAAKTEGDEPIALEDLDDASREQAEAILDDLRSLDADTKREALNEGQSMLDQVDDPQQRLMVRYVIQELKAMLEAEDGSG
ncbi:hypothetical protein AY599_11415 [Leptolyngbya valderiana BDU 20041]|nr:hypothetical protein AY599_11415 [Leptolyngbya valderiana BDU 20041]